LADVLRWQRLAAVRPAPSTAVPLSTPWLTSR